MPSGTAEQFTPKPQPTPGGRHPNHSIEDALSVFLSMRARLFGVAYRISGSAADAEDVVQNVWLRWQMSDRTEVRNAPAFLTTTTTRLAINLAESARAQRETYVGPWLPEPVDTSLDPCLGAERDDALELAVLVLLEKLSPTERAAYVLREAFNYPYSEIAEILRLTEANVRQLVFRARQHLASERRAPVSKDEQKRLLAAFVAAAQEGDVAALERLFAPDVVSYADGGGIINAARIPVPGRGRVAKYIGGVGPRFWAGVTLEWIEVNTQMSLAIVRDGEVVALTTISASAGGIDQVMWIMRPSKLAALSRSLQASRASSARPRRGRRGRRRRFT
jgi:RNA polymerase sigma-70 factor (TIGR02957 family)